MPENPHPIASNPRTLVFAVAVETCQSPAFEPVAFAENDAREFTKAWQALGVHPSDSVMLASSQATKTTLESSFRKFLRTVGPDDTVVFFFAGQVVACGSPPGPHLVTHDTQPDDVRWTSIPLSGMLAQLQQDPACGRVLLFLDAHACDLPGDALTPVCTSSGAGAVLGEELRRFTQGAANRVAFTACGIDETSWPSSLLQHGLWSYALIQALTGQARSAEAPGRQVTVDSLRKHLADAVPRLLRTTRTGPETQTPGFFKPEGNSSSLVVADLARLPASGADPGNALGSALKEACLRGAKSGQIRRLSGFRKGHTVPDGHFAGAEAFVRRLGHDAVKEQADAIHEGLRTALAYRRKDISYACDDGSATIKTPDFDVHIGIVQDADDAGAYRLTTEVGGIRRPEVLAEDGFDGLFSRYCDTLVIECSRRLALEDTIDAIEEAPGLWAHFHYEPDASSFTLELPAQGIRIRATVDRVTFSLPGSRSIRALLEKTQAAVSALDGAGVVLGLPDGRTG